MKANDVTETLELALEASGRHSAEAAHKPRQLSDNARPISPVILPTGPKTKDGPCSWCAIPSADAGQARALASNAQKPNSTGNYYLPGDLESQIKAFVNHSNNSRCHQSLSNVTPDDAYIERDTVILEGREKIKKLTIQNRRLNHHQRAA